MDVRNLIKAYYDFEPIFLFLIFFYGAGMQSFLNVVIYRVPRHLPFVVDRSKCESCGHTLSLLDLIPVISWVFLGGKCHYCKAKIPVHHMLSELLMGLWWAFVFWYFGLSWNSIRCIISLCTLEVVVRLWKVKVTTNAIDEPERRDERSK